MAGTAELSGYSRGLNTGRCEAMTRLARELFPRRSISSASMVGPAPVHAFQRAPDRPHQRIQPVPQYRTWYAGLDDGVGSGRALADLLSGRRPGTGISTSWSVNL